MPAARKRPCCICHRWFRPDNRVGSRQHACSKRACQGLRRRKRQAAWRARNPDYFRGRRIQARGASEQPPERHRRLLASLAASGQQTPIVVVAVEQPKHYLIIDGYQRVAALQQLGRDTVEAVVWSLSEVEALLLDRSMRSGDHETALEEGWLLVELEQRFGYGLEELARRFDRGPSWVSRRMGLVELLPESVQQQVRR